MKRLTIFSAFLLVLIASYGQALDSRLGAQDSSMFYVYYAEKNDTMFIVLNYINREQNKIICYDTLNRMSHNQWCSQRDSTTNVYNLQKRRPKKYLNMYRLYNLRSKTIFQNGRKSIKYYYLFNFQFLKTYKP